jgi:hypothetical protein
LRWAKHEARSEEKKNTYRILRGKFLVKLPLERPKKRWENTVKNDVRE